MALKINEVKAQLNRLGLVINSTLTDRLRTAGELGLQFNGQRDVYLAAGYPKEITLAMYHARYARQSIAKRVVEAKPDETWRIAPQILDGSTPEEASDDTDFALAWQQLATGGKLQSDGDTALGLLHYLHRLDCQAGLGQYGVLLLGTRDEGIDLSQPLKANSLKSPDELLYASVYPQVYASILTMENDRSQRRYGLPSTYQLTTTAGGTIGGATVNIQQVAHWTRVLHVADSLQSDDIFGTPRLEGVWNELLNLEKIMAASGESAWKLSDAGTIFSTKDGAKLPTKADEIEAIEDQIDEMIHGLRRFLLANGIEGQTLGGQMTDPTGLTMLNLILIAAATSIPVQVLLGTTHAGWGDSSSSKDERRATKVIEQRQQNFIWPIILRPLINRLIWCGALPPPASGEFCVKWGNLLDADRKMEADTANSAADALNKIGADVEPSEFVKIYLPELPMDKVARKQQPVAPHLPGDPFLLPPAQGGDATQPGGPFRAENQRWINYP